MNPAIEKNLDLVLDGARYRQTHKASVISVLGTNAPAVYSRGSSFCNQDKWTLRVLTTILCKWAKNNPGCTPTYNDVNQWVIEANQFRVPQRAIIIAATPDKLPVRMACALTGGGYHEAFHTRYSYRRALDVNEIAGLILARWASVADWSKYHKTIQDWSNIVEDIRIERVGRVEYEGTYVPLCDLQDFIINKEAEGDRVGQAQGVDIGALSVIVRTFRDVGLGYNTTTQQEALQNYQKASPDAVAVVLEGPLTDLLKEAINLDSHDDMSCLWIAMDVIIKLAEMAGEGDEQDQPQQGQGQQKCPQCGAAANKLKVRPLSDGNGRKVKGKGVITCTVCGWQKEIDIEKKESTESETQTAKEEGPQFEGFDENGDPVEDGSDGNSGDKSEGKDKKDKKKGKSKSKKGGDPDDKEESGDGGDDTGDSGGDDGDMDSDGDGDGDGTSSGAGASGSDSDSGKKGKGKSSSDSGEDSDGAGKKNKPKKVKSDASDDGSEEDGPDTDGEQDGSGTGSDSGKGGGHSGDGDDGEGAGEGEDTEDGVDDGEDGVDGDKKGQGGGKGHGSEEDSDGDPANGAGGHKYDPNPTEGFDWAALIAEVLSQASNIVVQDNSSALASGIAEIVEQNEKVVKVGESVWKPYDPGLDTAALVQPSSKGKTHDQTQAAVLAKTVKSESAYLRARLRSIVRALEMTSVVHGVPKGRGLSQRYLIDSKAAIMAGQNPQRAYFRKGQQIDMSMACAVVLDESGSMAQARLDATKIMIALAEPFDSLNCPTMALGFRNGQSNCNCLHDQNGCPYHRYDGVHYDIFKAWHERFATIKWRFANTRADGGTPMADGIQYALKALNMRGEAHRFMFVVTDGQPDAGHSPVIKYQIRTAREAGVHIIGIGMGDSASYVRHLFDDYIWVPDVETVEVETLGPTGKVIKVSERISGLSLLPRLLIAKLNELVDRQAGFRGKAIHGI